MRQLGEQVDPAHEWAGVAEQVEVEDGAGRGVRVGRARAIRGSACLGVGGERPARTRPNLVPRGIKAAEQRSGAGTSLALTTSECLVAACPSGE